MGIFESSEDLVAKKMKRGRKAFITLIGALKVAAGIAMTMFGEAFSGVE